MKVHLVSTSQVLNMFAVTAKGHDGETYLFSKLFPSRSVAESVAQRVEWRGAINPEHWTLATKKSKPLSLKSLFSKVSTKLVAAEQPKAA